MLTVTARDGTTVRAWDKGRGRPILIVHPGMDDGSTWHAVGDLLAARFRVVIPHRRTYRSDLPAAGMPGELDHIRALVEEIGAPVLLVGHSSGAVVSLEALVDRPAAFAGAVLYDPPLVADGLPFVHVPGTIDRARAAVAAGKNGKAFAVFARGVLRLPAPLAWLSAVLASTVPRVKSLVPAQIEDGAAIEQLGNRLDAYAGIKVPAVLLTGEREQGDLHARLAALAQAMPHAERVAMPKQAHSANRRAPAEVAEVVQGLANRVL